jgi:hypothetical protein
VSKADTGTKAKKDTSATAKKDTTNQYPLLRVLQPMADNQNGIYPGPVIGMSLGKDTAKVNAYLGLDISQIKLPEGREIPLGCQADQSC